MIRTLISRKSDDDRLVTDVIRARLILKGIDPDSLRPRRFESPSFLARFISIVKGIR